MHCLTAVYRVVLHSVCFACLLAFPLRLTAAGTDAGGYEVLANAYGFGVDIPGCPDASKNIREIHIDELNVDVRELTSGPDIEYRPGAAHWGNARFSFAADLAGNKEIQAWFNEAAHGKNIRKNITVTLFKSDKTPGRSYNLMDCFPTQWAPVNSNPGTPSGVAMLTVSIGSIDFGSLSNNSSPAPVTDHNSPPPSFNGTHALLPLVVAADSDQFEQVRGFAVEISGAGGKDHDVAWEHVSGGALMIEHVETTIGSDRFHTHAPGHKSIEEITLRGAMTDKRAALCTWVNDTVQGRVWKRTLTITETFATANGPAAGGEVPFYDSFPIRYVFPELSVAVTTGNFEEQATFITTRPHAVLPPAGVRTSLSIPNAPVASQNFLRLEVEDLDIDVARLAQGNTALQFFASIVVPLADGQELGAWFQNTQTGVADTRTITCAFLRQGKLLGTLLLRDCVPVRPPNFDTSGTVQTETLRVKVGRIEFKT